jgi:CRP-like cAMP-binding protein
MIDVDFLGQVEAFRDLGYSQLLAVLKDCEEVEFASGDRIFSEGEEPRAIYAVIDGEVALHWELPGRSAMPEKTVTTLGKHATFGWSSLVPPRRYSLSATCASDQCRVLKADRDKLLSLFQKDREVGFRVMNRLLGLVSARFLALQDEVARRKGSDIINRW